MGTHSLLLLYLCSHGMYNGISQLHRRSANFFFQVLLLNILIALYNSAYEDIYQNADDEYLALFSQKTMQFVRAPDENVYVAPLNLIEIIISGLTEWWLSNSAYETINDWVMGFVYSPLLLVSAIFETRTAHKIRRNRARGEEDDDVVHEWEHMSEELDFEAEGWTKTCDAVKPNVEEDAALLEIKKLRSELNELKAVMHEIHKSGCGKAAGSSDGNADIGGETQVEDESGNTG